MQVLPSHFDFIVVGAGIAGMRGAIELAQGGSVLVLAKSELTESATQYAQGGIAAALSDEDEVELHLHDTLVAGDGLCNEEAARVLVEEGPERIQELIAWGTQFDRSGTRLTFTREGAHSRSRILHAHGDSTGREIGRALYARAAAFPNITFRAYECTADLLVVDDAIAGVRLLSPTGETNQITASAVLLATGGLGQVYRETTNPEVATGDGVAMAWRCGAEISDMEFVQFHPTALYVPGAPRFLLSEALRGEGAYLRNQKGERFMPAHHPLAELAPRDVVARAIARELQASDAPDPVVFLDLRHLDADHVRKRFPRIYSTCLEYKVDIAADLVPVRPAAHYAMGGVRTDLEGQTSLAGLFAAGEVACTGVHGANRLASNSLLEGLVFGARAGVAMRNAASDAAPSGRTAEGGRDTTSKARVDAGDLGRVSLASPTSPEAVEALVARIRDITWNHVGIVRDRESLTRAITELQSLASSLPRPSSRRALEALNLHRVALLIAHSALAREESRGAHFRTDFPEHDETRFHRHSIVRGDHVQFA